jgi:hypothetical protein
MRSYHSAENTALIGAWVEYLPALRRFCGDDGLSRKAQWDDTSTSFWFAIGGPCLHEFAPLLQRIPASICTGRNVAERERGAERRASRQRWQTVGAGCTVVLTGRTKGQPECIQARSLHSGSYCAAAAASLRVDDDSYPWDVRARRGYSGSCEQASGAPDWLKLLRLASEPVPCCDRGH